MVWAAAVRIGTIIYKVASAQGKLIDLTWKSAHVSKNIRDPVVHGFFAGSIIGQILNEFLPQEEGGNIIGQVPPIKQRNDNRFSKARNKTGRFARGRKYCKVRPNRRR